MLRKQMFQQSDSRSLESILEEYSQEGLLDKIFPSIKRNREARQEHQKKILEQQEKDRDVFKEFVEGIESVRNSRDLTTEQYNPDYHPHGILLWDKKDNLMFSIVSLKDFSGRDIKDIEVKPKDNHRGVSVLDPWAEFLFGTIEIATTTDLDFDDYQVGDYFTDGFHTTGDVSNGDYLVFVAALDDPSLDRAHSTCSAVAYTMSSFGKKTFESTIDTVIKDRNTQLKNRKYLSMIVT